MKIVHIYDEKTGAYVTDNIVFPRHEEIKELVKKVAREEVKKSDFEIEFVEKPYEELEIVGYKEVYDLPQNSTEVPLPQPNWKPVFKDGSWIETITQDELDELNKPVVSSPTDTESLALQVSDLEIQLMEEQVKGEELAQTVSALEIAILELHPN
ncbi:hypothetical protein V7166_20465 [Bacillus thuringiensis]